MHPRVLSSFAWDSLKKVRKTSSLELRAAFLIFYPSVRSANLNTLWAGERCRSIGSHIVFNDLATFLGSRSAESEGHIKTFFDVDFPVENTRKHLPILKALRDREIRFKKSIKKQLNGPGKVSNMASRSAPKGRSKECPIRRFSLRRNRGRRQETQGGMLASKEENKP